MSTDISRYVQRFRTDTIYIRPATTTKSSMGAVIDSYGDETKVSAHLMPGGGSLEQAEYGSKAKDMVFAFVDPKVAAKVGDGVRVYVASGANPDYRIAAKPRRRNSYCRLDMEAI